MDPTLFTVLSSFLRASSGLTLTPDKSYLIYSRLQPLIATYNCKTIDDLIRKLSASPTSQLKQDIIEAMTTNETSFFRDVRPFDTFKNHVIPSLLTRRLGSRSIRILCMAASTGQEPYSLAMLLAESALALQGWRAEILAVDIDAKVLKRAEEGVYTQFETQRGLPIKMLIKYFDRTPDGHLAIKPEIRKFVRFQRCNLLEPINHLGHFDVIFCRNVLIYFDKETKRSVLSKLSKQIAGDGFLFLGGAETVIDITDKFMPAVGQRALYIPQVLARTPVTAPKVNTAEMVRV